MPDSFLICGLVGITLFSLVVYRFLDPDRRSLDAIPTVGPSWPLLSYVGAYRHYKDSSRMVQEGYNKYKGSAFKIATFDQWRAILTGPKLIDEYRMAPDDVFSLREAGNDALSMEYTLGTNVNSSAYHISLVRSQLTRSLTTLFPEVLDEIVAAFSDEVAPRADEWIKLSAQATSMKIVCRASNRAFVGLPLCRNADYGKLNMRFAVNVMKGASTLKLFPKFMRPLAGKLLSSVPLSIRDAMGFLGPLIEDRQRKIQEYGDDWSDKPNDMLMWLIEEARGVERSIKNWSIRILILNFAAIHTSSTSFMQALLNLATNPQYIQPMREEVEAVVQEHGWTKASMQKMHKVDSFLKESQRFSGFGSLNMARKTIKPFTFSDGTHIPIGTTVFVASKPAHYDEDNYENPEIFDGFRFAKMRQQEGEAEKHQFVSTGTDYIPFGHGRHACPGRFFAAAELKTMLAHLVVTYDVKFEHEGMRSPEVMFRKRQV